jgi:hypothetical protein
MKKGCLPASVPAPGALPAMGEPSLHQRTPFFEVLPEGCGTGAAAAVEVLEAEAVKAWESGELRCARERRGFAL